MTLVDKHDPDVHGANSIVLGGEPGSLRGELVTGRNHWIPITFGTVPSIAGTLAHSNGLIIFSASSSQLTSETMLSNRSNLPLCQVSMFNTSPISRKCDITVRTCKLLRHIIPLEEIDRNCLQLSYALFFGLIHISLTFSERDVGTALSYRDKNHFGASISRKTNFKSSIWKWQRRHFRKLLEVARFSLRDVTMAKIVRTNKLPSSPPPPPDI